MRSRSLNRTLNKNNHSLTAKTQSLQRVLFLFLVSAFLIQNISGQQEQYDFAVLRNAAIEEMKKANIPGAAIALIHNDQIIFAEGLGVSNLETKQPVTVDMLFQIGSVTKTFTAAVLLTFAEEGKIDLNLPIGKYVSGLNASIAQITLHQLLNQTSGLKDVPGEWGSQDEKGLSKYLRSLDADSVMLRPGTAFSYSNLNYALAGFVIEEISGKPYADVMIEKLFKPLGMISTTFSPVEAMTYPLAMPYRKAESGAIEIVRPFANDTRLWPAGYIYCSLNDFSKFARLLLNNGRLEGKQVIPQNVISKMMTPSVDIPTNTFINGHYGYGLILHEHLGLKVFEHGGTMPGFSASLLLEPRHKLAVIYLANNDSQRLSNTVDTALKLLMPQIKEVSRPGPKLLPISENEMKLYVGRYSNRWTMEVFSRDGQLYLNQFGTDLPITKIGENHFSITPENAPRSQEFVIIPSQNGAPGYMQMFVWAFKKTE